MAADARLRRVIEAVCAGLTGAEAVLTEMDQRVGDGDLGISMARAAQGIRDEIDEWPAETDPAAVLRAMSATIRRVVGGTSGPLYAILLMRAAATLDAAKTNDARAWSAAFSAAVEGVSELGGAHPGDRTMIDALHPAAQAMQAALDGGKNEEAVINAAVEAAVQGAAQTASMTPKRGRSSYLGDRALGFADPGAHAVALWLAAVRDALATSR